MRHRRGGFLDILVLIVIAFLILAYFRIDLRELLVSDTATNNWEYAKEILGKMWRAFLSLLDRIGF